MTDHQQELLAALRKVRAHTSYVHPTLELLQGLLASIERIADAAIASADASASRAVSPEQREQEGVNTRVPRFPDGEHGDLPRHTEGSRER